MVQYFFGIPLIMPAAGYTNSVIPIILIIAFSAQIEKHIKDWITPSLKLFFIPLITITCGVIAGYLVIGPIAALINNLLQEFFVLLFNLPYVGAVLGCTLIGAVWMIMVIFGFHWSIVPLAIINIQTIGQDYLLASVMAHAFSLGAVLFAMYLKNKDPKFRGICLPAFISAFSFGVTEPAIYGVALPDKKAFVNACIG